MTTKRRPADRRPLAGALTVLALVVVVVVAVGLFQDSFTKTVPVTVIADRAGLVMYPNAKVKINGAPVGKVASIEPLPDGGAALHLALDPGSMDVIPANVGAEITSSTVFGAKFVELVAPSRPSPAALRAGTVIQGSDNVTVELNTVFEKLVSVLSAVEPAKLNQTLGALSKSLDGRGDAFGQTLVDLDSALSTLNPALDSLNRALEISPRVFGAFADASPDLLTTIDNTTRISGTVIEAQDSLDALLISAIGLADIGTDVLNENRGPLTDVVHLLAPTTDLTNQYNPALTCGIAGLPRAQDCPSPVRSCYRGSSSAGSATGIRATCPRSPPRAGRSAPTCPTWVTSSGRRTSSPISARTRPSTETRASC
jgi:phospholipid/cholesterol/gamma-HCH transport system substrate-binding protein